MEYIESIKRTSIGWGSIGDTRVLRVGLLPQLYEIALRLIKEGKAYVDSLSPELVKEYRGTLTEPGKNSPDRDRPIEENLRCSRK
jgi:glutaminyl-tRNA synthetase